MEPNFKNAGLIFSVLTVFIFTACKDHSQNTIKLNPEGEILRSEITAAADQHFETWFPRIIDTVNGGYFTNFEYDWALSPDQGKMIVTQTRDLWASALAAQHYPNNSTFKKAADHGYQFITSQMWDVEHGGFFLNFPDRPGAEGITYKLLYGNAFALYALAEYAKINPSPEVKKWVEKTFLWIDSKARRPGETGYYNVLTNTPQDKTSKSYREFVKTVGWGNPEWKDQNTTIHILEAFSNAYRVWPDPRLKLRLEEILLIVRDKMVNANHFLNVNFDKDFKPISHQDSSREYAIANINIDHITFGHNIETAFLLVDASKVLYDNIDEKTMEVSKALLDHTIKYGFGPDYTGIYDKAYQFKGSDSLEIIINQKTWWAQAEALHSLILFADLVPEKNTEYMAIAKKQWEYIKENIIDSEHGGWYGNGLDIQPSDKTGRKAHAWKGPYHDGRALLFCKMYLNQ